MAFFGDQYYLQLRSMAEYALGWTAKADDLIDWMWKRHFKKIAAGNPTLQIQAEERRKIENFVKPRQSRLRRKRRPAKRTLQTGIDYPVSGDGLPRHFVTSHFESKRSKH